MPNEKMETLGAMIRAARKEAGLTQRELARLIDDYVESQQVSRWERGDNNPTAARLAKLIDVLGLDRRHALLVWAESQVPGDLEAEVAESVSSVEAAVRPKRGRRTPPAEVPPPPAPAPRARRGTRRRGA
jgi:transcriptional regulator with XRE-family HTH domain